MWVPGTELTWSGSLTSAFSHEPSHWPHFLTPSLNTLTPTLDLQLAAACLSCGCVLISLLDLPACVPFFPSFMYIDVWLHACLCECVESPETGVTDSCERPSGCRELNPCPLEEQSVFVTAEPSLQTPACFPTLTWKAWPFHSLLCLSPLSSC